MLSCFWGGDGGFIQSKWLHCKSEICFCSCEEIQAIEDLQKSWVEWVASALEHCSTQGSHSLRRVLKVWEKWDKLFNVLKVCEN